VKRFYAAVLTVLAALAATSAPARAALRVPQIPFTVSALQTRFNNLGESINVATQQQDGLVWGATVSGNSVFTIQFDLGPVNPGNNGDAELGIAKLDATGHSVTGLAAVFPSWADNGFFAVASFLPPDGLVVHLFGPAANPMGSMTYTGVNRSLFGYYIKSGGNTFYSHDGFNSDSKVHALAFAGTGQNTGCWWQCWEESPIANYVDADYNDAVVFMESVNPTPVAKTTWSMLKARFR
jgi:hypothetical protein